MYVEDESSIIRDCDICICVHVCMHFYVRVYEFACMHVCMHICMCESRLKDTCENIRHACIACMYMYMYILYVYVYVYLYT
jgi:hypothetical protein